MKNQMRKLVSLTLLATCLTAGLAISAAATSEDSSSGSIPDGLFTCTTSRDENNNILLDFKEFQLTLPDSWAGKCQVSTSADHAAFYHIASREAWTNALDIGPHGGSLFSICYAENFDFIDSDPSYEILGNGENGCYYASFPTDMQGYTDDADILAEFQELSGDVDKVLESVTFKKEGAGVSSSEYILLPDSSTRLLTEADVANLDADQIQMAINEIYAVHHRKFAMKEVQDYFNSKSWYNGYIEPNDFDVSVMNSYESQNIGLLVKWMEAKK